MLSSQFLTLVQQFLVACSRAREVSAISSLLLSLGQWANACGYRAGWYGADAVNRAMSHVYALRSSGELNEAFCTRALFWLDGQGVGLEPGEQSLIMVAVPRPAHLVSFNYRGRSFDLVLPPTYHGYRDLFRQVREDLHAHVSGTLGLRVVRGPYKALATHSGFARYGKNNITYHEGFGSYAQLLAFACRPPVEDAAESVRDNPEPAVLDRCALCRLCEEACQERAIDSKRFLLYAERCLTLHSEFDGELPETFGSARRACVVGCMACQEVCPENRGLLRLERLPVNFTEDETAYLLHGQLGQPQPPRLLEKVEALRCSDFTLTADGAVAPHFRRNLSAVLGHLA